MFGARKTRQQDGQDILKTISWPQLPGAPAPQVPLPLFSPGPYGSGPPALPAPAADALPVRDAEQELLEKIGAFRSAVADALYEHSNDYRILCNLAHADLKSCDDIMEELRERLSGSVHYKVLAKLDEAYALTETELADKV